MTSNITKCFKN